MLEGLGNPLVTQRSHINNKFSPPCYGVSTIQRSGWRTWLELLCSKIPCLLMPSFLDFQISKSMAGRKSVSLSFGTTPDRTSINQSAGFLRLNDWKTTWWFKLMLIKMNWTWRCFQENKGSKKDSPFGSVLGFWVEYALEMHCTWISVTCAHR